MTATQILRRVLSLLLGAAFLITLFWFGPLQATKLGRALGWPTWPHPILRALGVVLVAAGTGLFTWSTVLFRRIGLGTPVPTDPPEELVAVGPYRWSRNPMYLAYLTILAGVALWLGDPAVAAYAAVCGLVLYEIVLGEEHLLRRKFGERYRRYTRRVPRWLGRPERPGPTGSTGRADDLTRPGTEPPR